MDNKNTNDLRTIARMSADFGISFRSIERVVREHAIEPKLTLNGVSYFDGDGVDAIADHLGLRETVPLAASHRARSETAERRDRNIESRG